MGGRKDRHKAQIVNVGLTDAKIIEYSARSLLTRPDQQLPAIPNYGYKILVSVDANLKSGQSTDLPAAADVPAVSAVAPDYIMSITDDDNAAIRKREKVLYAFGYVRYEDSQGRPITTAFCRILEPPSGPGSFSQIGRFVRLPVENPDYDYVD